MAYVICEPCVGVCDTACVEVCPVDCIAGPMDIEEIQAIDEADKAEKLAGIQLFIDPDECISCGACEAECPVEAIYEEDEVPEKWADYVDKAVEFYENR